MSGGLERVWRGCGEFDEWGRWLTRGQGPSKVTCGHFKGLSADHCRSRRRVGLNVTLILTSLS